MKKTIINLLIFIYFEITYIGLIVIFYLLHFNLIHNTYIIGDETSLSFPEWCPFGNHTREMNKFTGTTIVIFPIIMSMINVILFNIIKKKIKFILFIIPIILIFLLYIMTYFNPID
jgi:hypothetical protein